MSIISHTLNHKGQLVLPGHWRKDRTHAALVMLPNCVLAVLPVETFEAMKRASSTVRHQYLHTLGAVVAIDRSSGRVQIPHQMRYECGFKPFTELVVSDHIDEWGETLRVSTADRWQQQVGDLFGIAKQPDFPIASGVPGP